MTDAYWAANQSRPRFSKEPVKHPLLTAAEKTLHELSVQTSAASDRGLLIKGLERDKEKLTAIRDKLLEESFFYKSAFGWTLAGFVISLTINTVLLLKHFN